LILASACQSSTQGFAPFASIFRPSAPAAAGSPETRTFDPAEVEGLQTRLLGEVVRQPDMIDLSICLRGLEGNLATGRVGQNMNGRPQSGPVAVQADLGLAPSSGRSPRPHPRLTNDLLVSAYGQSGRPFRDGGRSPQTGFDSPGLVSWVYGQNGVKLPQTAQELVARGKAIGRDDLRPGDVLAYKTPKSAGFLVGIYTGNGNFILASPSFNVVTETAAFGADYGPYFLGGRRFIDDPEAAPLGDDLKTAVANGAVKTALMALGDDVPKPANIYGGTTKKTAKPVAKRKSRSASKKSSPKKKASRSKRS
jgi:cell wall-associated NlpC family hydrolase